MTSALTLRPCAPSTFPTATKSNTIPSGTKCPEPYLAVPSIKLEQAWHFTLSRIVSAIIERTVAEQPRVAITIRITANFT